MNPQRDRTPPLNSGDWPYTPEEMFSVVPVEELTRIPWITIASAILFGIVTFGTGFWTAVHFWGPK